MYEALDCEANKELSYLKSFATYKRIKSLNRCIFPCSVRGAKTSMMSSVCTITDLGSFQLFQNFIHYFHGRMKINSL